MTEPVPAPPLPVPSRRQTIAEVVFLIAAAVVWFGLNTQWRLLNPFHTEWMLNGDWAATYHGWLFHIRGPFTLPPGLTPDLLAPWGSSVFYTNSIFWLCELGRVVALFVKSDFQLYGPFMASSYAGLAIVAWWLLRRLEVPLLLRLAGALILMAEPMLIARFGHVALTAQWLVMLQLVIGVLLVTDAKDPVRLTFFAAGAAAFAVGVEGYLAAMTIPLAVSNLIIARWRRQVQWKVIGQSAGLLIGGAALMLWLVGAIMVEPVNRTADGFGDFSADLGTLFNSHQLSRWIPGFPVQSRQGEGFGYLGLGTLMLVVTALGVAATRLKATARLLVLLIPLLAMVIGEAIYAASARVTFSGQVLFEAWRFFKLFEPLPSMFRASGRFVWAIHYLIGIGAVASVAVAAKRRVLWGAPLLVACVVQLVELPARPHVFDVPQLPPPLGAEWTGLEGKYRHLRVVPIQVQWVCGYNEALIARLSQVAVREGLSINSGLVGRVPAAVPLLCNARFTGPVEKDTIYVVDPNYVAEFHGAKCGALEGIPVCVAAETALAPKLQYVVP